MDTLSAKVILLPQKELLRKYGSAINEGDIEDDYLKNQDKGFHYRLIVATDLFDRVMMTDRKKMVTDII